MPDIPGSTGLKFMENGRELFECIGGPLDGEFRPVPDAGYSVGRDLGGTYFLDDTPTGAHWTWVPL